MIYITDSSIKERSTSIKNIRRTGHIRIDERLYRDMIKSQCAEIKLLFANILPLEINWGWDVVDIYAVSEYFDEVTEGEVVPIYTASICDTSEGLKITFERTN